MVDVARRAKVSISTVSRCFTAPEAVRPSTRLRIETAARELGYEPPRAVRATAQRETRTIALVVADIANPFFPPLIKSAQAYARLSNYSILLVDTDEDPYTEFTSIKRIAGDVDGVVVFSPRMDASAIRELMGLGVHMVFVNRLIEGIPAILMDMADGMRQSVEHLVALGHQRIAYVAGPATSWSNQQRRRSAQLTSRRLGVELRILESFAPTFEAGMQAAHALLASDATAAVAYNDMIALGLLSRLAEEGVRVPEDVSIVGFDDIAIAMMAYPALTTVAVPGSAAGRASIELLLRTFGDDAASVRQHVELRTQLMVRRSTGRISPLADGIASINDLVDRRVRESVRPLETTLHARRS